MGPKIISVHQATTGEDSSKLTKKSSNKKEDRSKKSHTLSENANKANTTESNTENTNTEKSTTDEKKAELAKAREEGKQEALRIARVESEKKNAKKKKKA